MCGFDSFIFIVITQLLGLIETIYFCVVLLLLFFITYFYLLNLLCIEHKG